MGYNLTNQISGASHLEKTLNRNIKKYRLLGKKDGIGYCQSAAAFAAHVGISPKAYINYESYGKTPSFDNLIKISDALGVSIDRLLDHKPPAEDGIRFFLDSLDLNFRTQYSEEMHCKEYVLEIPEKIKNDVSTMERMNFDIASAEFTIYETDVLRHKHNWLGRGKLSFTEDDFTDIWSAYSKKAGRLSTFNKYPFIKQLFFLGLVKCYTEEFSTTKHPYDFDGEFNGIISFLLEFEDFVQEMRYEIDEPDWYEIRKENDKWVESKYWQLQDKMNDSLKTEQLREIFLDMLNDFYKWDPRGGIKIIRQKLPIQSKKAPLRKKYKGDTE